MCRMFKNIIHSLIQSGMTESQIASSVNSTQASINRIKLGRQSPGYELGAALIALHDSRLAANWSKKAAA